MTQSPRGPKRTLTALTAAAAAVVVLVAITAATQHRVESASSAKLVLDSPGSGSVVAPGSEIVGWAIDQAAPAGSGIDAVHVWAHPSDSGAPRFVGAAGLGVRRPDVEAVHGRQGAFSGYALPLHGLAPGDYTLVVYGRSSVSGAFDATVSREITVLPGPAMAIEIPPSGTVAALPLRIAGWAIDRDAASGTGVTAVHVWAHPAADASTGSEPIFLGAAAMGGMRGEVAAEFGPRFMASGYEFTVTGLAPGTYDIVVHAYSSGTLSFNQARVVRVTVR